MPITIEERKVHTSTPNHPIGLNFVQDLLCVGITLYILYTLDKHIKLPRTVFPSFENIALLVWVADYRDEVPGAGEDFRRHEEGDLAVAAEEEDSWGWRSHFDVVLMMGIVFLLFGKGIERHFC
jgi:hypothetical protein